MTNAVSIGGPRRALRRALRLSGALAGLSVVLGACSYAPEAVITGGVPDDYRLRHRIAITEANRSLVVFVGHGRSGLTAAQRDDVMGLARTWVREGTGGIVVNVPVDTPNARAASITFGEIRSVLMAGGVPSQGIARYAYHPADPREFAPIKLNYTKIAATAGPCGMWPEDLGPSLSNPTYSENKPYYNYGCATQRNLAAMVDNPSDLVQPRAETPAYTARRTEGFDKYRKGDPTTTNYPESEKAKLSDAGK
jgi:pilus assembly protein CpaD